MNLLKVNHVFFDFVETINSILDMFKQCYLVDIFTLISGRLLIQFHTSVYLQSLKTMESVVILF